MYNNSEKEVDGVVQPVTVKNKMGPSDEKILTPLDISRDKKKINRLNKIWMDVNVREVVKIATPPNFYTGDSGDRLIKKIYKLSLKKISRNLQQ